MEKKKSTEIEHNGYELLITKLLFYTLLQIQEGITHGSSYIKCCAQIQVISKFLNVERTVSIMLAFREEKEEARRKLNTSTRHYFLHLNYFESGCVVVEEVHRLVVVGVQP